MIENAKDRAGELMKMKIGWTTPHGNRQKQVPVVVIFPKPMKTQYSIFHKCYDNL